MVSLDSAIAAPVLDDAPIDTGRSRPIEPVIVEALLKLSACAALTIAVDLPSGAASDDGAMVDDAPDFDLTLAPGAVRPAHLLQPAAYHCGADRLGAALIADDLADPVGAARAAIEWSAG